MAPTELCTANFIFRYAALTAIKYGVTNWGSFPDRPLRLHDLVPPDGRQFVLEHDFVYLDRNGVPWLAPTDLLTDGATIPSIFWSVIGGPWDGLYREAAVVHDAYCCAQTKPWQQVHRMFYEAMRCSGVGWVQAKTMYYAVWVGGPRWKKLNSTMPDICKAAPLPRRSSRLAMQWPGLLTPDVVDQLWQTIRNRPLTVAEARAVARPFFNRASMTDAGAMDFVNTLRQKEPTAEEKDLITLSVFISQRFDEKHVAEIEDWVRRENPSLEEIESRAEEIRAIRLAEPHIFPDVPTLRRPLSD